MIETRSKEHRHWAGMKIGPTVRTVRLPGPDAGSGASGGAATGMFPNGLRVSARGAEVRFGFSVRGWDRAFARSSVTTISPRSIVESLVCPSASDQVCPGCLQLQDAVNSRR